MSEFSTPSPVRPIVIDLDTIKTVLPHRYPFLLIDRVIDLQDGSDPSSRVGRKVKVLKNVTVNEPFFQGHFPERPIMPGVLLIEAMAQASALAAVKPSDPKMNVAIVLVDKARFRRPVIPGDTVIMHSEVLKDRGRMLLFSCQSYVDDQLVAEAEIMANVWPLDSAKAPIS